MATGGRHGDIPWDEELNLKNLLNAPAIVKIVDWEAVGLELGIEEHILKKIDRECRGRTNDCVREMLSYLLDDALELTWKEVSHAVRTVTERQTRQKMQKTMEEEERNARQVFDQLPKSLHQLKIADEKIEADKAKLSKELGERNAWWDSKQKKWNNEDQEWKKGEERRQKTKTALQQQGKNSQLVQQFLQEKGFPNDLTDDDVDRYLRKEILEKQVDRSKQLRSRLQKGQIHHRCVQHLLEETKQWKNLVDGRVELYGKVLTSLKEVGLNEEKVAKLKDQLEELTTTLDKYTSAIEHCEIALRKVDKDLRKCEYQLEIFSRSIDDFVQETEEKFGRFIDIKGLLKSTGIGMAVGGVAGIAVGVTAGTAAGTVAFPVVGSVLGGTVGLAAGGYHAYMHWQRAREVRQNVEKREFNDVGIMAKLELERLNKLFKQK